MTHEYDPLDPRHMQARARNVFARAARMQDLHGQALSQASAQHAVQVAVAPAGSNASLQPQPLLEQVAVSSIAHTLATLQSAAAHAAQMAQADPVIAALNASINGADPLAGPASEVIDVTAVERPDTVLGEPERLAAP